MELGKRFTYIRALMLYVKKEKNERQFFAEIGARLP